MREALTNLPLHDTGCIVSQLFRLKIDRFNTNGRVRNKCEVTNAMSYDLRYRGRVTRWWLGRFNTAVAAAHPNVAAR